MKLKNDTSKFRPLFYVINPAFKLFFSDSSSFTKTGHPEVKLEKSLCKNKNESILNPAILILLSVSFDFGLINSF